MQDLNDINILIPVNNPLGGIRTYVLAYFKYLAPKGLRFTFLAPQGNAFKTFRKIALQISDCDFIEVPDGQGSRNFLGAIRRAVKSRNFSLIHSQGLKAGTLAAVANYFTGIPHLITLHDVIVPQNDIPGKFKRLKKLVSGYFTRHADVIIPVSEDCMNNHLEHFPQWKKGPCKVQTVLNGIDLDIVFQKNSDISFMVRKELQLRDDLVLFGLFGRFMPQKGFLPLLEAVKILHSRGHTGKFRIIATRDRNGYFKEYTGAVENDEVLRDIVLFVEQQNDVSSLMLQMDAVLMPSLWEACPLVPMEAMVHGVPFIGSECLGLREVMRNTPCISHSVDDPVEIADAIEKYLQAPWNKQAEEFAPEAQKRFDVRIGVEKVADIYRELLAKTRKASR